MHNPSQIQRTSFLASIPDSPRQGTVFIQYQDPIFRQIQEESKFASARRKAYEGTVRMRNSECEMRNGAAGFLRLP